MKEEDVGQIDFEVVSLTLEPQELLKPYCLEMTPQSTIHFSAYTQHGVMASALEFINMIYKKHFSFNGQCWLWNFKCVIKEILCELLTKQPEFLIMWAAWLKKLTQGFLEKTPWFWQGVLITAHRVLSGLHAFVFNKAERIIKWFLYYFFFGDRSHVPVCCTWK